MAAIRRERLVKTGQGGTTWIHFPSQPHSGSPAAAIQNGIVESGEIASPRPPEAFSAIPIGRMALPGYRLLPGHRFGNILPLPGLSEESSEVPNACGN
jgi:hypothetical protein